MSQDDILTLLSRKDEQAFTYLYDTYSRSLFAVISNIIKDRDKAEAALYETFEKIWNDLDTFSSSNTRLFTWAVVIARNTAIDKSGHIRKNLPSDNFVHLADAGTALSSKVNSIGVREFVKKLKPRCIQHIELLFFKGYPVDEAASDLEIQVSALKLHNRACINDLRNYLQL